MKLSHSLLMIALFGCGACANLAARREAAFQFHTGTMSPEWTAIPGKGARVALHHAGGGTMFAQVSCTQADDDAPLEVLTNHLLFDFRDQQELERTSIMLDGRAALRTKWTATLDGVPVALDLVVLKKEGCTVDMHLIASPSAISARTSDFERFFNGFQQTRGGG